MGVTTTQTSEFLGKDFKVQVDIAKWMSGVTMLFDFHGETVRRVGIYSC